MTLARTRPGSHVFREAGCPRRLDVVRVEIERIGHIENRVVDEPDDTARL